VIDDDIVSGVESLDLLGQSFVESEERWLRKARAKQILPISGWSVAIARSGRGFGKTEMGAQWVRREAGMYPGVVTHAVAPTHADLLGTMFNGISGLLSVTPPELIASTNLSAAIPTVTFKNGSVVRGFSSQSPERLRGPQASRVWGDEVAAWMNADETLYNIDFSTRIAYKRPDGTLVQPQKFYTTTPKALDWLKKLIAKCQIEIVGSTYETKDNLADDFIRDIQAYEGTEIGRQELYGELLDMSEAAIIKQRWLRLWPAKMPLPHFDYIIVAMDTAFTEKTFDKKSFKSDPTACQVWGVFVHEQKWNMFLIHRWNEHLGFPELTDRAREEMNTQWGAAREQFLFKPLVGEEWKTTQVKKPDILLIEDLGSGKSLRQSMEREGVPCFAYNPGRADKLSRLHQISHVPKNGRIWLPESAIHPGRPRDWVWSWCDEVCVYSGPGTTRHDDDVDTFSMACRYFADNWLGSGVRGKIRAGRDTEFVMVSEELIGDFANPDDNPVFDEPLENYYG
jgi:phage terminase large subunit-like protein